MRSQQNNDGVLEIFLKGTIDSANAGNIEREINVLIEETNATSVTLNCTGLEYVSSAGLRVFMKLAKRLQTLRVDNVSSEVYEVFDITGLSQVLDVRKAMREVDVSGLELLGEGANGKVYRLTPDEMIKVFRPGISLDDIESERQVSRQAFLLGVPCAIPFDTVRCGDSYGTVYEMFKAVTLSERIVADPGTVEECAVRSAEVLRSLHGIEVSEDMLPEATRRYYGYLEQIASYFTDDENERLRHLWDAIPHMDRFVHSDYHPKNVMYSNGELMIIDLGDAGSGNPLLDWIHTYSMCNLLGTGMAERSDDEMSFIGITYGDLHRFWKIFSETYFGTADRAERMSALLEPWGWLAYLSAGMCHPLLNDENRLMYAQRIRDNVLAHDNEMIASLPEMQAIVSRGIAPI